MTARASASFCVLILLPIVVADAAADDPAARPPADDHARPRYELQISPWFDAESGARDLAAAVTGIGAGEERLFRWFEPAGIVLRPLRTLAWDAPIAWWFGVALHEGFGHGGRGRELHTSPSVHLGSPWEGRTSYSTFDGAGKSTEELLYIYIGGTEANGLAATLLERRAVEGVRLRPLDLLFLVSNRLVASDYVLRTTPSPRGRPARFFSEYSGGGDVARYLGYLHELHADGNGITPAGVDDALFRQYRRLRRQAYWNLLDPGVWWALGSALRAAASGDTTPPLPLPHASQTRFLPVLSSEWTPSGGETSLEWIMAPNDAIAPVRSLSLVARRGRGPSGSFGALGLAAADLLDSAHLSFGGAAEVWRDPRNGLGAGARLRARFRRGWPRGLYLELGLKSQGYWVGQPATAGPYGALGFTYGP
ncbi:MAG TPA: hypothetical protein VFT43_12075 [Candidatus Polarisedimenticolia bacterium]|nr:hypothetical protein [Candidatus Polarisedimenticolia bacterium]